MGVRTNFIKIFKWFVKLKKTLKYRTGIFVNSKIALVKKLKILIFFLAFSFKTIQHSVTEPIFGS